MPKIYLNEEKQDVEISFSDETIYYPQIIGQRANASFVDYSNPRENIITVSVGVTMGEIVQALSKLDVVNGGILRFTEGTFLFTTVVFEIPDRVTIEGAGIDKTIIDFQGNAGGFTLIGTSTSIKKNNILKDFTVQNSNSTAGIDIDFADFWRMENVRVTSCDQTGIRIEHSQNFVLNNVRSDNNTSVGFLFSDTTTRSTVLFSLTNCLADDNGSHGYHITQTALSPRISDFTFVNCSADSNIGDGFLFDSTSATRLDATIVGGYSAGNANGYTVDAESGMLRLLGTLADSNTIGYNIQGGQNCIVAALSRSNTTDYNVAAQNAIVGNIWFDSTNPSSGFHTYASNGPIYSIANLDASLQFTREYHQQNNNSGSTINQGDVVIFNPASGNIEAVTRTTTGGDSKVLGMALETIVNNQTIKIQTHGFNNILKVNGTTDIAIGDYLCTFTTAGIAQKATTTGQVVFAIALEAYATDDSNGVIDSYILPWRFPLP